MGRRRRPAAPARGQISDLWTTNNIAHTQLIFISHYNFYYLLRKATHHITDMNMDILYIFRDGFFSIEARAYRVSSAVTPNIELRQYNALLSEFRAETIARFDAQK